MSEYTGQAQNPAEGYRGPVGGEGGSETAEKAREKASEYRESAQQQAEAGKEQAAGGMERAAEMTRERMQGQGGMAAQAGGRVAEGMESAAGYLRTHDTNEMWNDIESYARTHPAQALAGAIVTGFFIGRILR